MFCAVSATPPIGSACVRKLAKDNGTGSIGMKTASGIPPVNTATIYWATPGHKQVVRPKLRPAATTVSLTVPVHLCLVRAWCPIRRALRCATPRTKRFLVSRQVLDAEPEASAEAAGCADEFLFVVFSTSTKPARNLLHSCRFCFSDFFSRLINKIVRPVLLASTAPCSAFSAS